MRAVEGNLQTALDQPNAIVLTETAALKYFGSVTSNSWQDFEYIW